MSVQNTINQDPAIAVPGMEADNGPKDVITQVANETIPFGNFVCRVNGNENKCRLPEIEADITESKTQLGIARQYSSVESKNDGLAPNYSVNNLTSVATSGRYYVLAESDVTVSDDVFVRFVNKSKIVTISYDADFQEGDTVNIIINGATIGTAWDTDNATTYAEIDTALTNSFAGTVLDVAVDPVGRTVIITSVINVDIVVSAQNTAGGAVPTVATTQASTSTLTRGQFRNNDDNGSAALWSQARYVKGALENNFAVVEINQ